MDKDALNLATEQLAAGQNAVLCFLFETDGSTPRRGGALLCVAKNANNTSLLTSGTVGGGEIELASIKHADVLLNNQQMIGEALEYDLSGATGSALDMACGGRAKVLFVPFGPEKCPSTQAVRSLISAANKHESAYLNVKIEGGEVKEIEISPKGKYFAHQNSKTGPSGKVSQAQFSLEVSACTRLFIIGAGHVAKALCPVASKVGFGVTVYDSRAELATKERFDLAEDIVLGQNNEITKKLPIGKGDFVCIMTPGHEGDWEATVEALKTQASYIGLIGSHHKIALTKESLATAGASKADIDRLNAPVGLEIGAETPDEIAISITAQLIAARAKLQEMKTGTPGHNLGDFIKKGISII